MLLQCQSFNCNAAVAPSAYIYYVTGQLNIPQCKHVSKRLKSFWKFRHFRILVHRLEEATGISYALQSLDALKHILIGALHLVLFPLLNSPRTYLIPESYECRKGMIVDTINHADSTVSMRWTLTAQLAEAIAILEFVTANLEIGNEMHSCDLCTRQSYWNCQGMCVLLWSPGGEDLRCLGMRENSSNSLSICIFIYLMNKFI